MKKILFHTFHTTEPRKKQEREGKETGQQTLLLLKNMTPASRDDGLSLRWAKTGFASKRTKTIQKQSLHLDEIFGHQTNQSWGHEEGQS